MDIDTFLAPVIALIIWSLVVWGILFARRVPAISKLKINVESSKSPDGDWKKALPLKVEAPAHNYNHLMEQPTIFYAFMFWAAITGEATQAMLYLAWAYVVLRIMHSFIQISTGPVMARFGVFLLSSVCLIAMIVFAFLN
ncbi:MAG: MAPEG family protein [Pseudomonadota bacterium]